MNNLIDLGIERKVRDIINTVICITQLTTELVIMEVLEPDVSGRLCENGYKVAGYPGKTVISW